VVPSRADDAVCSPGEILVPGLVQAGSNQRFHVHEFWWIQGILDAYRIHSAVLCVEFLLFGERREEREKERKNKKENWLSRDGWGSWAVSAIES
jgi:hypothetical protein